jgi:methylenetetrahydrofolate--tRNA-(uracil-5-)-methyltransferase
MRQDRVIIVGAGLAGSEAAWQIASRGIGVDLYEMRPRRMTEAHTTTDCAELVCSNSFGSDSPHHASRLLKEEVEGMGGLLIQLAREHSVPAGQSLAIDRQKFSAAVTQKLESHPLIRLHREEIPRVPREAVAIVATGPLTSPELARDLLELVGGESLYFYDAISPIVSADSLDYEKLYFANRYGKGETADFLNLPLTREQYDAFVDELLKGDVVLPHDFEEERYFEGCMPIEAIAARGRQTLAFGPMKPVGLDDPRTGRWPHAVIQMRTENRHRTAFNLVGFQTKLKYGEQLRIFRQLPGLENAEFLRLGSMHRNTYLDSPRVLEPTLQLKKVPSVFIAGQLTGTEGYLESVATGCLAGWNAARLVRGEKLEVPPPETMLGALLASITDPTKKHFQPTNVNLGLFPPLDIPIKKDKKLRNAAFAARAGEKFQKWKGELTAGA